VREGFVTPLFVAALVARVLVYHSRISTPYRTATHQSAPHPAPHASPLVPSPLRTPSSSLPSSHLFSPLRTPSSSLPSYILISSLPSHPRADREKVIASNDNITFLVLEAKLKTKKLSVRKAVKLFDEKGKGYLDYSEFKVINSHYVGPYLAPI